MCTRVRARAGGTTITTTTMPATGTPAPPLAVPLPSAIYRRAVAARARRSTSAKCTKRSPSNRRLSNTKHQLFPKPYSAPDDPRWVFNYYIEIIYHELFDTFLLDRMLLTRVDINLAAGSGTNAVFHSFFVHLNKTLNTGDFSFVICRLIYPSGQYSTDDVTK